MCVCYQVQLKENSMLSGSTLRKFYYSNPNQFDFDIRALETYLHQCADATKHQWRGDTPSTYDIAQWQNYKAWSNWWMLNCQFQVHIPSALSSSGIPPLFSSTGHNIEFVLQMELPLVSSAFKMSGYTPAQVNFASSGVLSIRWHYAAFFTLKT